MTEQELSRRERQIMDAVYLHGEATVNQVLESMDDPPTRTTVRTILRILVDKAHLTKRFVGRELIYAPTKQKQTAGQSAFRRVIETFFNGSLDGAFAAHFADADAELTDEELKRLAARIREARKKGK